MDLNICVFCSSSDSLKKVFYEEARKLGELIGKNKCNLVHGGGMIGIMGEIARSVQKNGGKVMGIIPEALKIKGVISETDDEIVITKDMNSRKALMRKNADVYIALPGGFGTLEEISEVITLKQLKYHSKPVIFLNTENFFNNLFNFYEDFYTLNFAAGDFRNLYFIAKTPEDVFDYIINYDYKPFKDKYI
jgi:cytokinin riboside 5'-monophosphate phosphoribohydrolase